MSDEADRKLYLDEINRCHRLSLEVTAPAPPLRTVQTRNARYYAERGRILGLVDVDRAVAFLRGEACAALAGERSGEGWSGRWFRLHHLEFGGDLIEHTTELMAAGVARLVREGIADLVADYSREKRHG